MKYLELFIRENMTEIVGWYSYGRFNPKSQFCHIRGPMQRGRRLVYRDDFSFSEREIHSRREQDVKWIW